MSDEWSQWGWWTSPVDGHRHANGPDPDLCAVCALEAGAEQLKGDLRVANQNEAALQGHFDIAVENALAAETEVARLRGQLADLAHAVRGMQAMHARLGTGDDEDEEAAFLATYAEAVADVLALELPEDP